ncbi:hypothetical protein AB8A31_09010 [Tardiphaga sp. 804_B3_N1_9]|uniref:hypothetical protein n=1 Tax=Tardiphaga sp. 804_B3_N1_9 TaxID=3240786 RepID=UPI003F294603
MSEFFYLGPPRCAAMNLQKLRLMLHLRKRVIFQTRHRLESVVIFFRLDVKSSYDWLCKK